MSVMEVLLGGVGKQKMCATERKENNSIYLRL